MELPEVTHNPAAGRFEIQFEQGTALLSYFLHSGTMTITHTEVPLSLRGGGIAAHVTQAALEYARANRLRVVPLCSYVASYLERHPEYRDVLTGRPPQ